jgi:hypothetical protein
MDFLGWQFLRGAATCIGLTANGGSLNVPTLREAPVVKPVSAGPDRAALPAKAL